ncbi:MAG: phosphotransferase [Nocardioides sp.]|nr:phosphotransferase [Nocardioides sp.]
MSLRLADLGDPLAVGRSAEVFAWPASPDLPADLVVKLFAEGYAPELVDAEEAACAEVLRIGLTGIRCHGQVRVESRAGLLLDRIHGDSLTRLAERNPLRLRENSRVLAREHIRMHEGRTERLPEVRETTSAALDTAPLGFLTGAERGRAEELIRALPAGDRVLHLDYHPENVFAHDGGYTSIDWQTALRGDPAADVATTVLLLHDAELWPGTPALKRLLVNAVRRMVLSTYLAEYYRLTAMTPAHVDAWRVPALVLRMSTLDIPSERDRFRAELRTLLNRP